jgi:hypothetical protein
LLERFYASARHATAVTKAAGDPFITDSQESGYSRNKRRERMFGNPLEAVKRFVSFTLIFKA